ncbi:nucleoside triphosphate pyrophosphohydrolase [Mycobacterium sp. 050128]|uniref:nucleoside triphosphate pyrophosphohydrolase n=1 Tax=Mycobacterium sp. 050128 TaxID=3096112 RepID=UPI002EDA417F
MNLGSQNRYVFAAPSGEYTGLPIADMADAGGKGAGLMRIPPDWYPPTIIVGAGLHAWFDAADAAAKATLEHALSGDGLGAALSQLVSVESQEQVLVRSSALNEGIAERGAYETFVSQPDVNGVASRLREIWVAAQQLRDGAWIAALLQPQIAAKLAGHLSNEHRVSRESYGWLATFIAGGSQSTERWRVSGDQGVDDGPLHCSTVTSLTAQLRRVANWFSSKPTRYHLEWVWDGNRLWIVQADPVHPVTGKSPGDCWIPPRAHEVNSNSLRYWEPAARHFEKVSASPWRKIESLREFYRAALPVPEVWALSNAAAIEILANGGTPEGLLSDLQELCAGHIVVRVDVTSNFEGLMLPKINCTNDPTEVVGFLRKETGRLVGQGIPYRSICFLAHRYLRARACAWTISSPHSSVVTIDSCWGLADGMSWLPHDRFMIDVDGSTMQRSIVGKPSLYDVLEDRSWGYRDTPSEWIWRSSMSEQQFVSVARGARRLAVQAGEPVLTMWFIGLLDGADADCIPSFQNHEIPENSNGVIDVSPTALRASIKSRHDLAAFDDRFTAQDSAKVLLLAPTSDLVRDPSFIHEVIEVAQRRALAVELDGSPLCHPFYLLQRAGIPVVCRGVREAKPVSFGKLVRDAIPDLIALKGESVVTYRATPTEISRLLRVKLIEEAMELFRSSDRDAILDEIADLLEVVDALRRNAGLSIRAVTERRRSKRESRGAFDEGRVLVATRLGPEPQEETCQLALPVLPEGSRRLPRWQVQLEGDRLAISNIPPMPGEAASFVVETASGARLAVEYATDGVVVTLDSKPIQPDQPTLFQ